MEFHPSGGGGECLGGAVAGDSFGNRGDAALLTEPEPKSIASSVSGDGPSRSLQLVWGN